jgi:hypothetical protein
MRKREKQSTRLSVAMVSKRGSPASLWTILRTVTPEVMLSWTAQR